MPRVKLSIIIPFYNDQGCAEPFIKDLKNCLNGIPYEIILVDDGSTDQTPQELDKLADENIYIIHNKRNRDYGGAILAGLKMAQGEIVCFTNGDGKVDPQSVINLFHEMNDREVLKGIRINRKDGITRKVLSAGFNFLVELRFHLGLKDVNGYPVFFRRDIYESLADLREDWLFNLDLYRKIIAQNHQIWEIPVEHQRRSAGKSHTSLNRITKAIPKFFSYCLK